MRWTLFALALKQQQLEHLLAILSPWDWKAVFSFQI